MKYSFLFILCLAISFVYAQEVTINPERLVAGQSFSISYDAQDGELSGHQIWAVVYELSLGNDPIAHDVQLSENGSVLSATYTPSDEAEAILLKFANEDETIVDANEKKGYVYHIYKNGKIIEKSSAAIAEAITLHRRKIIIEEQEELANVYLNEELKINPSINTNFKFLTVKGLVARLLSDDDTIVEVIQHVKKEKEKKNIDKLKLIDLALVAQYSGSRSTLDELGQHIAELYPNSNWAMRDKISEFRNTEDIEQKEIIFSEVESITKRDTEYQDNIDQMASRIAGYYGEKNDEVKFKEYSTKIESPTTKASLYNNVAWTLSGESIDTEPINLRLAEELSKESLRLISTEKEAMTIKPVFQSKARYGNNMNYNYAMYSDTYALLAHHLGHKEDALKFQTLAVEAYDYKDGDMNTRYAVYMENQEGGKAVMPFLEKMMVDGMAGTAMKAQYKRIFKSDMNMDMAYDKVVKLLEKEAKAKQKEKIKEDLFVQAPKDFSLLNLKGEKVSLESVEGKVVVLDFWATWCGPCKASFPGMQQAVDKYADNPLVEFLFIDTWERAKDKEANATKFLDSKGYRFNVLMDNENAMVQNFGISGIPTKYILDRSGQLRYKGVGYDGNDAKLVDELSIVIEMLLSENDRVSVEP